MRFGVEFDGFPQNKKSGQIIATSHDLTPNGGLVRGNPLISGFSRLVNYCNLARKMSRYPIKMDDLGG